MWYSKNTGLMALEDAETYVDATGGPGAAPRAPGGVVYARGVPGRVFRQSTQAATPRAWVTQAPAPATRRVAAGPVLDWSWASWGQAPSWQAPARPVYGRPVFAQRPVWEFLPLYIPYETGGKLEDQIAAKMKQIEADEAVLKEATRKNALAQKVLIAAEAAHKKSTAPTRNPKTGQFVYPATETLQKADQTRDVVRTIAKDAASALEAAQAALESHKTELTDMASALEEKKKLVEEH